VPRPSGGLPAWVACEKLASTEGDELRRLFTIAALATTALVGAGPAQAQEDSFTFGDADVIGPVHVRGDVARVHARYSCDVGTHLWVSVKQSAARDIDPAISAEGSGFGGTAAAWWQSHRGSFTCDGKRHVGWFTVDTVEPGSRGQLRSGWGWVQFCITTDEDLDAVRMEWSKVVTNR
jgi:hypothetical protein